MPEILQITNIPQALQAISQFYVDYQKVPCMLVEDDKSETGYRPTHSKLAAWQDETNHLSFGEVFDILAEFNNKNEYTAGFHLTGEFIEAIQARIFIIDLDKCLDEKGGIIKSTYGDIISPVLNEAIKAGAFIEKSSSGRGLHIIGKALFYGDQDNVHINTRIADKNGKPIYNAIGEQATLEIYSTGKQIALTGDNYIHAGQEGELVDIQSAVNLHKQAIDKYAVNKAVTTAIGGSFVYASTDFTKEPIQSGNRYLTLYANACYRLEHGNGQTTEQLRQTWLKEDAKRCTPALSEQEIKKAWQAAVKHVQTNMENDQAFKAACKLLRVAGANYIDLAHTYFIKKNTERNSGKTWQKAVKWCKDKVWSADGYEMIPKGHDRRAQKAIHNTYIGLYVYPAYQTLLSNDSRGQAKLNKTEFVAKYCNQEKLASAKEQLGDYWQRFKADLQAALGCYTNVSKRNLANMIAGVEADSPADPAEDNEVEADKHTMTNVSWSKRQLICDDYEVDDTGVYEKTKDGRRRIFKTPILIDEKYRNEETGTESMLVRYGADKSIIRPKSNFFTKSKIETLSDYGFEVSSERSKKIIAYLDTLNDYNDDIIPVKACLNHLGWTKDRSEFLPFIGTTAVENVMTGGYQKQICDALSAKSGTRAEQLKALIALRRSNAFRTFMAASLASILVPLVGSNNTFVAELIGETEFGKTQALLAIAGIFGGEPDKLKDTCDNSRIALIAKLSFLQNLPLFLDEVDAGVDTQEAKQLIMQITNGTERGRGNTEGEAKAQRKWHSAILFTGEVSLADNTAGGGADNRLITIPLKKHLGFEKNEFFALVKAAQANYGHIALDYIHAVASAYNGNLADRYKTIYKAITDAKDMTGKQADSLTYIHLADEIFVRAFNTGETPLNAIQYGKTIKEVSAAEKAWRLTVNWIAVKYDRFTTAEKGDRYGSINEKKSIVYVNANVLEDMLKENGHSIRKYREQWLKDGRLIKETRWTECTTPGGSPKAHYYKLSLAGEKDDNEQNVFGGVDTDPDKIPY